jgi:archaeal type IV pilus assembly protein PilA
MRTFADNETAVSPVVGVMLMLVVTIIIAAVVSAFAGGLSQGTAKAPQLSLAAEAHEGSSIILDFKGGDTVSGGAITVKTFIPMGNNKDMSYTVNLTKAVYLPTGFPLNNCTEDAYGYTSCTWYTIQTGDKIKINWADAFGASSWYPGTYLAPAVGEPFNVEVYDSATGKAIAIAQTNVLP